MSNKLKEVIFKPKWLHKDAAIRARAVKESSDPRLLALLPELARRDRAASVRLNATRRLTDMYTLMRLSTEDADTQVRALANKAYHSMMTGEHAATPELAMRLEMVPKLDDQKLIEHLARNACEKEIRAVAQRRVDKQGLLGDLAIKDPDAELRTTAAGRLTQKSTLERVANATRKQDKKIYRLVIIKLEELQLAAGDDSAQQQKACSLCEELETLGRSARSQAEKSQKLAQIEARWEALKLDGKSDFEARYHGARLVVQRAISYDGADAKKQLEELAATEVKALLSTVEKTSDGSRDIASVQGLIERAAQILDEFGPQLVPDNRSDLEAAIESLAQSRQKLLEEHPAAAALTRLFKTVVHLKPARTSTKTIERLQHDWDREWSGLTHPHASDHALKSRFESALVKLSEAIKVTRARRAEALESIDSLLENLESRLEEGNLSKAAKAKQKVLDALRSIGRDPRIESAEFKSRIIAAKGRLHELRDWQHWSNNKLRERICERAEEIQGSGMHPDALAARLRELRQRWRELDDGERLPGDPPKRMPNPKLWHRFQAACNKAFKPAKTYFDKRDEIRDSHLGELQSICVELESAAADEESQDWKQMEQLVGKGRRSLRGLHQIPPRMRREVSKRLREGANALDARLDERYATIERQKQRLIDTVVALQDEPDLGKATAAAKEAQKQWQKTGQVRRKREQKMWKSFRAASDAVFGRLDEQRAGEREARDKEKAALTILLQEMESLLERTGEELDGALPEMHRIQDQWRQCASHDRGRDQRFSDLCEQFEAAVKSARREQRSALKNAGREIVNLCRELESAALSFEGDSKLHAAWSTRWETSTGKTALPQTIVERCAQAMAVLVGDLAVPDYQQQAASHIESGWTLCIEAEYLAGAKTPADFQQARMDYQVSRLSARMGGADSLSPTRETEALEQRWLECGPLPESEAKNVDQRFLAAIRLFEQHQDS
jgi:exonuclease SbcC